MVDSAWRQEAAIARWAAQAASVHADRTQLAALEAHEQVVAGAELAGLELEPLVVSSESGAARLQFLEERPALDQAIDQPELTRDVTRADLERPTGRRRTVPRTHPKGFVDSGID